MFLWFPIPGFLELIHMSKRNINEFGGGGGVEAHWRSEPGKPSYKMFTNSYI